MQSPITATPTGPRRRFRRWAFLPLGVLAAFALALALFSGAGPASANHEDERPADQNSAFCSNGLVKELTLTGSGATKSATTTGLALSSDRIYQTPCRSGLVRTNRTYHHLVKAGYNSSYYQNFNVASFHFARFYTFTLTKTSDVTITLDHTGGNRTPQIATDQRSRVPTTTPRLNLWGGNAFANGDTNPPSTSEHPLASAPQYSNPLDSGYWNPYQQAKLDMVRLGPGTYTVETTTRDHFKQITGLGSVTINLMVSATPAAEATPNIDGLTVTPGSDNLTLRWNLFHGASQYRVQWKSSGQDYSTATRTSLVSGWDFLVGGLRFNIPNLTRNTQYTVRVTPRVKPVEGDVQDVADAASEITGTPGACFDSDLTSGTTVQSSWIEGCKSSIVQRRGRQSYVRYFDFSIAPDDGRQEVSVTGTGSSTNYADVRLYTKDGYRLGAAGTSSVSIDLEPGDYNVAVFSGDNQTGDFSVLYTANAVDFRAPQKMSVVPMRGCLENEAITSPSKSYRKAWKDESASGANHPYHCRATVGLDGTYAHYYTFTITNAQGPTDVTINMRADSKDTGAMLALWRGGHDRKPGDYQNLVYPSLDVMSLCGLRTATRTEMSFTGSLEPGYYTIEAAAWKPEMVGSYTLDFIATPPMLRAVGVSQDGAGPEPPPSRGPSFGANVDTTLEVAENSPAGTNVGAPVTATDPDGDPLTYSLSGDDAASFTIDANTGRITTIAGVTYDYETKSSYSLLVVADDGKGLYGSIASLAVTVNLFDLEESTAENWPPRFHEGWQATRLLAENSPPGTNVGRPLTVFDPNGDALAYEYYNADGTDSTDFALSDDGQLTTIEGVTYDYETKRTYELLVLVRETDTDAGYLGGINVTVNLTDVDEETTSGNTGDGTGQANTEPANRAPVFGSSVLTTLAADENSASGTNVGAAITATDPDDGDTVTYTLTGTDAASFAIGSSTGQITTVANVDYNYEAKSSYSLSVDASDGKLSNSTPVTINLNDVAEAPTVSDTTQFKTHNATVGTAFSLVLPAADANSGDGGPYKYLLWHKGAGKNLGTEAVNGLSFNATTRTLSGTPAAEGTWELNYVVHDGDANTNAAADAFRERDKLKIVVAAAGQATGEGGTGPQQSNTEPANRAPAFDAGIVTTLKVDENSASGTNVGAAITATDPDAGDTVTYSLTGTDAASFDIGSSTGQITTVANVTYDFETKSSYTLAVDVSDGKGGTNSTPVTVKLNDVNEAPAFASDADTTLTVNENSPAATNVGSAITATDPDKDATLAYSLSGTDAASFAIGGSTGQITTIANVTYDYETKSSYSLTVDVSDGKLSDSIDVTVSLNNVNEAPAFADDAVTALSVNENSAAGTKVGSVFTATDPDASDTLAYSLSGTDAASFVIGALTGQIATKTGETYNYEAKSSYSLTVVATDAGGLTDSVAVTVSLNNVAEAPTVSDTTQFKNHAATVGQTFSLVLPAADENSGDGGPYEYLLWHRGHGQNFMDQAINGLSFNATTRTLSGTPTAAGVWQLSYVVHDDDTDRSVEDRFRAKTNLQITVSQ